MRNLKTWICVLPQSLNEVLRELHDEDDSSWSHVLGTSLLHVEHVKLDADSHKSLDG